ncbi:MAG: hypothetical protein J6B10_03945 [Lachnospiraceae bacterium]|nr:hypothetical protein [Lachnospiraceae bacterium]
MKKKLTDNLGLKILAVLCSVVLWLVVINIEDPVIRKKFSDIPVTILNTDSVTEQGKVFEVLDGTDTIDVTVAAKRSIISTITRESIVATADMQDLTFMNTVHINLATNENNDKLENIRSDTENLKVNVEDVKRVQMVIETTTAGEPGDGYMLGEVSTDQNLVRLSGPESKISKVARAAVEVSVEGITTSIQADYPIRLYDADGNIIEDKSITKSISNITVSATILQKKEVPLRFAVSGTPADGYQATGEITSNPETVVVAGRNNVIKNIAEIAIPEEALNITGQNSDMLTLINLKQYLPENVFLADSSFSGKVSVTVYIEKEETAEIRVDANNIVLQNVPEGMEAEIRNMEEPAVLETVGLAENISKLTDLTITGFVDINTLKENDKLAAGTYHPEVTLNLPDGVELREPFQVVLSVAEAQTDKAEEKEEE